MSYSVNDKNGDIMHLSQSDNDEINKKNIVIDGIVERITFHNNDNGFCVLRVSTKGKRGTITVVGNVATISNGETINVSGKWYNDSRFGLQLRAENINIILPSTINGLRKYLGSGLIKGIGPHFASKIVDHFGSIAIDIIESAPHRLIEIEGIGQGRAELIAKSWLENRIMRDIMVFLQGHGVSVTLASKIFKYYDVNALEVVKNNPYQLARDIKGVGFLSADKIALNLGIKPDSPHRAQAALTYILHEASTSGHCALPEQELLDRTEKELKVDRIILEQALKDEIVEGRLIPVMMKDVHNKGGQEKAKNADILPTSEKLIFLPIYLNYENFIAQKLLEINKTGSPLGVDLDVEKALIWLRDEYSINLSSTQAHAIQNVLNNKVSVITGGPGTGKTTLVNSIIKILISYKGSLSSDIDNVLPTKIRIKLAAPTGRAAKRLSESVSHYATTIHRLLEFDHQTGGFKHNAGKPLFCDLLIIDESSMLDVYLMFSLLKAITANTSVILVGDVDQIPSIGPGQILKDIIESNKIPVTKLNKIFRQATNSRIVVNAHLVNKGIIPQFECNNIKSSILSDFLFCEITDEKLAVDNILRIFQDDLPKLISSNKIATILKHNAIYKDFDIRRDVQVLCPMQKGIVGVKALNIALQKILNPSFADNCIEVFGQFYSINDKVMQIENNYDKLVFNGDIGYIKSVDREECVVLIDFDGYEAQYAFDELDQLVLAYAITIHKSQGSEYPIVILPILTQHFIMLNRNLLYTAITRGKNLVILLGQKRAIAIAVKNNSANKRYTTLGNLLAVSES